mgnify:CR=1 FL=1
MVRDCVPTLGREIDPERITALLYGGQDVNDRAALRQLDEQLVEGALEVHEDRIVRLLDRRMPRRAGGGKGDHAIVPEKTYYFGFAIHEDHANARYHYVSLGYQFGSRLMT